MRPAEGHARISSKSSLSTNKRRIAHSSLRCLGMLGVFVELVADSAHREHVMRILRIGFELLPQTIDVRIDIALITFVFGAPDAIEQVIARPGAARLGCE